MKPGALIGRLLSLGYCGGLRNTHAENTHWARVGVRRGVAVETKRFISQPDWGRGASCSKNGGGKWCARFNDDIVHLKHLLKQLSSRLRGAGVGKYGSDGVILWEIMSVISRRRRTARSGRSGRPAVRSGLRASCRLPYLVARARRRELPD